jgi:hypothetical protein
VQLGACSVPAEEPAREQERDQSPGAEDPDPRELPSRITARSASLSAVSGKAFTNGWIALGKRSDEKNTPEKTNIGSITRFIRPEAVSIFFARLPTRRPRPAKTNAPSVETSATETSEPCRRTSNTSQPKKSSSSISAKTSSTRLVISAPRKCVRRMGVATRRFSSRRERMSTMPKPTPHIPPLMMFMPSRPGIRKSM